jgi:hypothetical protein
MRRRSVVVTVAVATAALALAGCGDDGPSEAEQRAEQLEGAAAEAGLPDDVADLLADAARGVDGTYRVTYELADESGGPPQRLTIVQAPPNRRFDVDRADGPDTATIGTAAGTQQCERPDDDQPYTCELVAGATLSGVFSEQQVAELTDALTEAAPSYDFAVEDRTIAGVEARCLVATRRREVEDPSLGEAATLCLSPEGAQLLVDSPSGTIRAVEYSPEVADDAFVPPTTAP